MGRKLSQREKKDKIVKKVLKRISTIEKVYGADVTRLACQRYATREAERVRLQTTITEKERELQSLKKLKG